MVGVYYYLVVIGFVVFVGYYDEVFVLVGVEGFFVDQYGLVWFVVIQVYVCIQVWDQLVIGVVEDGVYVDGVGGGIEVVVY